MMQYYKNNDWYEVIRITGPSHNLLGLKIGDHSDGGAPSVESMLKQDAATPQFESALQKEVLVGVHEANVQFATDFQVSGIRYVGSDPLDLPTYRYLAKHLIEHVAKQGDFIMRYG
jgi:hypothetical protein